MNSQVLLALFYCFCFSFFGLNIEVQGGLTDETQDKGPAQTSNTGEKPEKETNKDGIRVQFSLKLPGVTFYSGLHKGKGVSFIDRVLDKNGNPIAMSLTVAQQLFARLKEQNIDVFGTSTRKVLEHVGEIVGGQFEIRYHDYDAKIDLKTTILSG